MSEPNAQRQQQALDPLAVASALRHAAGNGGAPIARDLLAVLHAASSAQLLLAGACADLMCNPDAGHSSALPRDPGPHAWPLPDSVLWGRLLTLIGEALKGDPTEGVAWACFRAIRHGAVWLLDAERLASRDGHLMRQRGGLRLAPAVFNGERLRAEILPADPHSGVRGDVLRLTWEDTGRLVAQSLPGRFSELDVSASPE